MAADVINITFRRIGLDDLPMLSDWLHRPHWREWWGDPVEELGFIRDMVEGRDTTEPYLILQGDQPVGYIQVWFVGDNKVEPWLTEAPWLKELDDDCVGVDLSLADPATLSKGLGTAALRAFVKDLRARGFDDIIIDPDPANARAVRAYTKAGFRPIADLENRSGDSLILRHEESL